MLSNKQYGFREAGSTEDAIVHLTTNIYKALDKKAPSMAVFVDLAKAFDTVDHAQLLEVLNSLGFRGTAHALISDYLTDESNK